MGENEQVRKSLRMERIQRRKEFKGGNHSRKYGISDNLDSEAASMLGLAEHNFFLKNRKEFYRKVQKNR
mgnify:CR=1 FL=1